MREEMEVLTSLDTYRMEPEEAWKRLKMRVRKPVELAILQEVAAWREREAQTRDVPRGRVIKDDAIYEIAAQQPTTASGARRNSAPCRRASSARGLPRTSSRAVKKALSLPKEQMPKRAEAPRRRNGNGAAVDLLKVLLKMISENHGVASKVIATVDDLEAIAADDDADVPALHGWRRELFGEAALRLKRGEIALAVRRTTSWRSTPERAVASPRHNARSIQVRQFGLASHAFIRQFGAPRPAGRYALGSGGSSREEMSDE